MLLLCNPLFYVAHTQFSTSFCCGIPTSNCIVIITLPETNIFAPENGWLEYDTSFLLGPETAYFQVRTCHLSFIGPSPHRPRLWVDEHRTLGENALSRHEQLSFLRPGGVCGLCCLSPFLGWRKSGRFTLKGGDEVVPFWEPTNIPTKGMFEDVWSKMFFSFSQGWDMLVPWRIVSVIKWEVVRKSYQNMI